MLAGLSLSGLILLPPPNRVCDSCGAGERFGLSRDRFEFVLKYFVFGPENDADKWAPVRPLVAAFNKARQVGVNPGYKLCGDESMSYWRGKSGNNRDDGMPHVVKIVSLLANSSLLRLCYCESLGQLPTTNAVCI